MTEAEQERARVVAWLRWEDEQNSKVDVGGLVEQSAKRFALACRVIANAIEARDHLKEPQA